MFSFIFFLDIFSHLHLKRLFYDFQWFGTEFDIHTITLIYVNSCFISDFMFFSQFISKMNGFEKFKLLTIFNCSYPYTMLFLLWRCLLIVSHLLSSYTYIIFDVTDFLSICINKFLRLLYTQVKPLMSTPFMILLDHLSDSGDLLWFVFCLSSCFNTWIFSASSPKPLGLF